VAVSLHRVYSIGRVEHRAFCLVLYSVTFVSCGICSGANSTMDTPEKRKKTFTRKSFDFKTVTVTLKLKSLMWDE